MNYPDSSTKSVGEVSVLQGTTGGEEIACHRRRS
jgi:hypothetical protein